ncbi:porin family protein [Flavobacterium antarcticum]|uniref:porin family protein n=1 Tax=Flavobacterium antarcticum TaxID=271155 RepID=UPI0003B5CE13|nr:porin family protein [Flavobacterium antarcticum]
MKKLFLTAFLTLGCFLFSFAQNKGDVEFGVNLGFNLSNATADSFSTDTGTGFNVGFSTDYFFSDHWSIKGKLIYDQKGWDNGYFQGQAGVHEPDADYNLNYLTIPVTANWHFGSKRNWYLHFGPYVGFLLNAKESSLNTEVTDYYSSTDFGLAVGIGVKIPVSDKLKIFIEYDGQSGFLDIFRDNRDDVVTGARSAFNVGLNFMMK